MLSSQHAIVGGAVGLATGNPFLGFLAGIASHHILDLIPHVDGIPEKTSPRKFTSRRGEEWPKSEYIIAYVDSALTLVLLFYLVYKLESFHLVILLLAGAVGGVFPDLMDNVPFWKKWFRSSNFGKWYHENVHMRLHFHWNDAHGYKLILAMILQIMLTIGGVWVSLRV